MTIKLMSPLGPGSSVTATTLTGTYSTQSTIFRPQPSGTWAGSGALRTNPTATTGNWTMRGWGATGAQAEMAADTLYASIAVYVETLPGTVMTAFQILNSASAVLARWNINPAGTLAFGYADGTDTVQLVGTTTVAIPLATWTVVDVAIVNVSAAGGASIELRIDGQPLVSASGLTIRSGSRTIDRVRFGAITSNTVDFYWADLVCDDAGYPGNQYVGTLTPDSSVTDQWATGTATGFAPVASMDGVTAFDSDTSYIGSSTSGNVATVGLKAITPEKRRVTAVMPFAIWRDEGGSSVLNLRHISGATTTNLSTLDPGATYVMNAAILSTDPATSAAWTAAAVDAFVVGIVNGANVAARCTALGAYVAFTPGQGGAGQGGVLPMLGVG
jgi:hypothetical protein